MFDQIAQRLPIYIYRPGYIVRVQFISNNLMKILSRLVYTSQIIFKLKGSVEHFNKKNTKIWVQNGLILWSR